jgi:hypothetical protein
VRPRTPPPRPPSASPRLPHTCAASAGVMPRRAPPPGTSKMQPEAPATCGTAPCSSSGTARGRPRPPGCLHCLACCSRPLSFSDAARIRWVGLGGRVGACRRARWAGAGWRHCTAAVASPPAAAAAALRLAALRLSRAFRLPAACLQPALHATALQCLGPTPPAGQADVAALRVGGASSRLPPGPSQYNREQRPLLPSPPAVPPPAPRPGAHHAQPHTPAAHPPVRMLGS